MEAPILVRSETGAPYSGATIRAPDLGVHPFWKLPAARAGLAKRENLLKEGHGLMDLPWILCSLPNF